MRTGHARARAEDATFELSLAPMLDMLVCLITVLLVSFTTMKLGVLDTSVPQPVAQALEKDRDRKDRQITFELSLTGKKTADVLVKENGRLRSKVEIAAKGDSFDLERIHRELVGIKLQHPDIFRLEVSPTEDVAYNDIVKVFDQVRMTTPKDPKVFITDEKDGKQVETNLLFPDVIFGNIVGE